MYMYIPKFLESDRIGSEETELINALRLVLTIVVYRLQMLKGLKNSAGCRCWKVNLLAYGIAAQAVVFLSLKRRP